MVATKWIRKGAPSKQVISSEPRAVEWPRQVPTVHVVLDAQDETSRWINQRLQSLSEVILFYHWQTYQNRQSLKTNLQRVKDDNRHKPMGVLHQPKPRRLWERPAWLDDPSTYEIRVVDVKRSPWQPVLSPSTLSETQVHVMTGSQEPDATLQSMGIQKTTIPMESRLIGDDQFGILIPTTTEDTLMTSARRAHEGPTELYNTIQTDLLRRDEQSMSHSDGSEESLNPRRELSLSTASGSHDRVLRGVALQTGPSDPYGYGTASYPAAGTSSYITSASTTDKAEEGNREMRWLEEGMLKHQQHIKTSKLARSCKFTRDWRACFSKVLGKRRGPL
ncbi:hypothetical protein NEOLEDRAFT_1150661 [Neolentinus lepideus HHB14362 ss-1]|uniref:Uncharacterized protein n=1 Tax=Neolentinus lepideus HHB14362 ss-1 TaxID=1314782 RepID=A0A165PTD6_9AGAM|nr:hypothetical protein NEOLEDRAFT_1150661 [Neolentinus lepideus HHB14362 ss-1]